MKQKKKIVGFLVEAEDKNDEPNLNKNKKIIWNIIQF